MLPTPIVQEHLSRAYVLAICAMAGCNHSRPEYDCGIDLVVHYMGLRGSRPVDGIGYLGLQLKATTVASLQPDLVTYDLPIKNYDDPRQCGNIPKLLVVYVMPKDQSTWLTSSVDDLRMRRCAYWADLQGHGAVENAVKVRVRIPRDQVFDTRALSTDIRRRVAPRA